jgi:hypothetical protein
MNISSRLTYLAFLTFDQKVEYACEEEIYENFSKDPSDFHQ